MAKEFKYEPQFPKVEGRTLSEALTQFVEVVKAQMRAFYKGSYKDNVNGQAYEPNVKCHYGPKYTKITVDGGHYASMDADGNLYKGGGYGRPAKHPRANVLVYDYLDACGPYGMKYLTGGGNYKFYRNGADKSPMDMARDALIEGRTQEACQIMYDLALEGRTKGKAAEI